ncbi:MAG: hypothetical protein ACJAUP_001095 [Cellvibrionaceae bacterium]|jgi:hypothetical protein
MCVRVLVHYWLLHEVRYRRGLYPIGHALGDAHFEHGDGFYDFFEA